MSHINACLSPPLRFVAVGVQSPDTKFLVDRDGLPAARYSPQDPLDQGMEADIVALLERKPLPPRKRTYLGVRMRENALMSTLRTRTRWRACEPCVRACVLAGGQVGDKREGWREEGMRARDETERRRSMKNDCAAQPG